MEVWAGETVTLWDHVVMPLGCDDNPLELHCKRKERKKEKVARVQWLECRRPHVFIFAVPGPCVRCYGGRESCGTENNICLSQVPEEIVALARRGRVEIWRRGKKYAPCSGGVLIREPPSPLARHERPQNRWENKCKLGGCGGRGADCFFASWLAL